MPFSVGLYKMLDQVEPQLRVILLAINRETA